MRRILLDQFLNIITQLLAAAVAISWAAGDRIEALAILLVLLLNAAIGFGCRPLSMLFLGTVVTAGRAVAVVVATGERTELGRIGKLVTETAEESTPLQRR